MGQTSHSEKDEPLQRSEKAVDLVLRQKLTSYTPLCNLKCALICNIILVVLFIAFGIPIIVLASSVTELTVDYTNCVPDKNSYCQVPITVTETMSPPINIYYSLTEFFLNQRDIVRSRSFPQLRNQVDKSNLTRCNGALLVGEMFDFTSKSYLNPWNNTLNSTAIANPCGLAAKSYFNDTYTLSDSSKNPILINETNISSKFFRDYLFVRDTNYQSTQWTDVTNEHFIVWMQTESFPNFIKLYGRVNVALTPEYNVTSFGGTKSLYLATSSAVGRATFLGFALIGGAAANLISIVVLLILASKGSRLDKVTNLNWE